MTPFRFQTAQKNSASLRSSVPQFENSLTLYRAVLPNDARLPNCLRVYRQSLWLKFRWP